MTHDFLRVAAGVPRLKPADYLFNADQIITMMRKASKRDVDIIAFPHMAIMGSTCGDLRFDQYYNEGVTFGLLGVLGLTAPLPIVGIVGAPLRVGDCIREAAVVFQSGRILGAVVNGGPGERFPTTNVQIAGVSFNVGSELRFRCETFTFAVTLGDDLFRPVSTSAQCATEGASVLFHLDAMPTQVGRHDALRDVVREHARRCIAGLVYVSAGHGESSTDHFFDGEAFIADRGRIVAESEPFSAD